MKKLFVFLISIAATPLFAQQVSTVDFMKTVDNNREELIYYYEHNWKVFRDIALERGYIHSYELMITEPDSLADFDIILITRYENQKQFDVAEEKFQAIIEEVDEERGGLQLLNDLKPNEFRAWAFNKTTKTKFSSFE